MRVNLNIIYKIVVKDKGGKIVFEKEEESKSPLKNFLLLLNALFRETYVGVVDTSGTTVNTSAKAYWSRWCSGGACWCNGGTGWCNAGNNPYWSDYAGLLAGAGEEDDTYGIIVGTNDTPVTPEDYNLGAKISHGSEDGQLYYKGMVVGSSPRVEGDVVEQVFSRVFRNDGSVDVSIKEIGFVVVTSSDNYKVLIIRDVLTNPVVVPGGGGVCIVTYKIQT